MVDRQKFIEEKFKNRAHEAEFLRNINTTKRNIKIFKNKMFQNNTKKKLK